jgi:hypothetical protein
MVVLERFVPDAARAVVEVLLGLLDPVLHNADAHSAAGEGRRCLGPLFSLA